MKRADSQGSITVEATISLVTFLLAFVSVLSVISICRVQHKIDSALKAAALDISRYSYFYYVLGGYHTVRGVVQNGTELIFGNSSLENADMGMENLAELTQVLFGAKNKGNAEDKRDIFNVDEDIVTIILTLLSECTDEVSSAIIAAPIAQAVFNKELRLTDAETDRFLESNGVVDGWSGLDFGMSELFSSKSPRDISLCVRYCVRVPFLGGVPIPIMQHAVTGAWLGGDRTIADSDIDSRTEEYLDKNNGSVWRMSAFNRGQLLKEIFSKQYKTSDSIIGMRGVIGYDASSNTYHNCVSINTFSESYNYQGFQAAASCEHTIRKLLVTIDEVQRVLDEGTQAHIEYTVIIPENADGTVVTEIQSYLEKRAEEMQKQNSDLYITFRIVKAGGKADT